MSRILTIFLSCLLVLALFAGCAAPSPDEPVTYPVFVREGLCDLGLSDILKGQVITYSSYADDLLLLQLMKRDGDPTDPDDRVVRVLLFDLKKGEITADLSVTDTIAAYTVLSRERILRYGGEGETVLCDGSLAPLDAVLPQSAFLGADGGTLWFWEEGVLLSYTTADGKTRRYPVSGVAAVLELIDVREGIAYFSADDENYIPVLCAVGEEGVTVDDLDGAAVSFRGDRVIYQNGERWYLATPDRPDEFLSFPRLSPDEFPVLLDGDRMVTIQYTYRDNGDGIYEETNECLRLYDLTCGGIASTVSSEELPGYHTLRLLDGRGDRLILSTADAAGNEALLLWDTADATAAPNPDFRREDRSSLGDEAAAQVTALEERYGIDILCDQLSLDAFPGGYALTAPTDTFVLLDALELIDEALARYPDGFFDEMRGDGNSGIERKKGIRLYLSDRLTDLSGTSVGNAAGVANSDGACLCAALDINSPDLIRVLGHEFTHLCEYRLNEYADEHDFSFTVFWNTKLNSPAYPYYDSYRDESGRPVDRDGAFTLDGGADRWFLDTYSRTFATEDRARVFENLFCGTTDGFDTPELTAKARFLAAAIRAAFPSVADKAPCWETFTGKVSLSDYIHNKE